MAIKWYKISQFVRGFTDIYNPNSRPHLEERQLSEQYYLPTHPRRGVQETTVVVCVDGHYTHGGLSDRLRGMATIYGYCKRRGIPFRIYHVNPFPLQEYLLPHQYDWSITAEEMSYHPDEAVPVVINGALHSHHRHERYLDHALAQHSGKQLHIYTHAFFHDKEYHQNFQELFLPAPRLSQAVDQFIEQLGEPFVGVTFRFQQLLGDFVEGDYPILPCEEREILIERCLQRMGWLHDERFPHRLFVVTSDSNTFLRRALNFAPWVRTIPGQVVHMDYTDDASYEVYLKSFVDLFVLSRAQKLFLLRTGQMYRSGFPQRAALQGGIPWRSIEF